MAGTLLLLLLFILGAPTLMRWITGDFKRREMFVSVSPDGRYRVSVTKRVQFPANELLDPSIWVDAELIDV